MVPALSRAIRMSWPAAENQRSQLGKADASKASTPARSALAARVTVTPVLVLAKTFGVPPAFFFDDFDEQQLGLLKEQVELLTLVRDAKITSAQFRALLGLDDEGRRAVADAITRTARAEAERLVREQSEGRDNG